MTTLDPDDVKNAVTQALTAKDARIAELEGLVRDAIEDPDEFETEWNKQARAALTPATTGRPG